MESLDVLPGEAIFQALFTHMTVGCAICRMVFEDGRPVDWQYLKVNPAYEALTGLKDVEGRRISEAMPAFLATAPELLETYGRVASGHGPIHFERPIKPLGVWVKVHAFSPEPGLVIATVENQTGAKLAQERLLSSEKRFRLVAENTSDMVWTMDFQGHFTYMSPSVEGLRGFTQSEVLEHGLEETLAPWALPMAQRQLQEALASVAAGEPVKAFRVEWEELCKGGATLWTEVHASVMRDDFGKPAGFVGVTRDITERKRLEAEQRALHARMDAFQRMDSAGQVASGVVQELDNVLATIMAMTSILDLEGGEAAAKAKVILKAAVHGQAVVKSLQDFARKEATGVDLLDLNTLAGKESDLIARSAHPAVQIQLDLAPGLPRILGDEGTLTHAIRNICLNAVEAMPGGGRLTLRTGSDEAGGEVVLSIEDTGVGMSEGVRARAMEPFFTTKLAGKGRGLGLSAAFGTVRAHDGTVAIHSRPRQGTRVQLTFPGVLATN